MHIVNYPHPTLRHESKPLQRVDGELKAMVEKMFELMYQAKGVGLAANQVDLPFRLFIVNLKADSEEGEEYVFINPVVSRPKGHEEKEEGCLSLPELYGQVRRPETIEFAAYDLQGVLMEAKLQGLMARVVQHEVDHLDGVLFTDRLSTTGRMEVEPSLEEFEIAFRSQREQGEFPSDEEIARGLAELEKKYC